jgi:hypothetical protein
MNSKSETHSKSSSIKTTPCVSAVACSSDAVEIFVYHDSILDEAILRLSIVDVLMAGSETPRHHL